MFGWLASDWMLAITCLDEAQMGWKYWQDLNFQTNLIHLIQMLLLTLECYTITSFGSLSVSIYMSLKNMFRTLWPVENVKSKLIKLYLIKDKYEKKKREREIWTHSQGASKHNLISGSSP